MIRKLNAAICFALAALSVAGLSACGSMGSSTLPSGTGSYAPDTGLEYRLGPGDKIRVTVYGEEALSGEFIVANNGHVAVPLVGEVPAGGMSPSAFQGVLQERLIASGMVRSPRVSADVVEYRPYYILGEVTNPGKYPYAVGLTVTKAVATAGGFTYRANHRLVYITREGTNREVPVSVTASSWIWPGDTIRVAERYF